MIGPALAGETGREAGASLSSDSVRPGAFVILDVLREHSLEPRRGEDDHVVHAEILYFSSFQISCAFDRSASGIGWL